MPKPVIVRAQALDGTWEVIGADRAAGRWPEDLSLESDPWGSARASFNLKRDGRRPWPDLTAFTPIDIEVDGKPTWAGRITETPNGGANLSMNVQCEGAQSELDDDAYERTYVHERLGDWKDYRTASLTASLPDWPNSLNVTNDRGAIIIGCPNGTTWPAGGAVGVTIDVGTGPGVVKAVLNVQRGPGTPGTPQLFCRGHTGPSGAHPAVSFEDGFAAVNLNAITNAAGGGFYTASFTGSGFRYVTVFLYVAAAYAAGADDVLRILGIRLFTSAAWEVAGVSALKASNVVTDALATCQTRLSADRSLIQASSFNIPAFGTDGPQTAREAWSRVNDWQGWLAKVDALRRPVYRPKSSGPAVVCGEWSPMTVDDASSNSGAEVYDRVMVTGTSPAGEKIVATRTQTGAMSGRRGYRKTFVLQANVPLSADLSAANNIGDVWLAAHRTTPFRGTAKLKEGSVRDASSGEPVGLERLLEMTGELVDFQDRVDPDTGAWCRLGRIAGFSWNHKEDEGVLTIDNTRTLVQVLLNRLGVMVNDGSS